ncbi:MAG: biotin--[acetyl-CoA-carboxylase] ligase, partial [Ornithinimicrobium sp.]
VCGILAAAQPGVVIIGTGLNIDQTRDQLPTDAATSWALAAGEGLPAQLRSRWLQTYLQHVAAYVDELCAGPATLRARYRQACSTIGQQVRVDLPGDQTISGMAIRVDDRGALVVRTDQGMRTFHAGDVVHLRPGDVCS